MSLLLFYPGEEGDFRAGQGVALGRELHNAIFRIRIRIHEQVIIT